MLKFLYKIGQNIAKNKTYFIKFWVLSLNITLQEQVEFFAKFERHFSYKLGSYIKKVHNILRFVVAHLGCLDQVVDSGRLYPIHLASSPAV